MRVSRVGYRAGERFISPVVQREQILGWAQACGAQILEVWEELDESGGRRDRPLLETAIERIERGLSAGLVVAKVDRFGRSLLDGLTAIERIERAGGTFFSVADGLDLGTDTGRLVLRIMLSMAEWELDRARTSWATATAKAIGRGAYTGAYVPAGYRKTRAGRLTPDRMAAPAIAEVFRRRAAGDGLRTLARVLEQHGVRTGKGNPGWTAGTTWHLLANEVYLGRVKSGRFVNDRAHPPIVDRAPWEAAQRPRCLRPVSSSSPALLTGLVRCASCGMAMRRQPQGRRGRDIYYYACRGRHAAGVCPAPAAIAGGLLDPCVEDIVFDLLLRRRRPPLQALRGAERRVADVQAELARYRDSDRVLHALGEAVFADGLAVRVERLRQARTDLAASRSRLAAHRLPTVAEIDASWPAMTVAERREIIGQVIDLVFVEPGRLRVGERVTVCPAGTAPAGLPRIGSRARLRRYPRRARWIAADKAQARIRQWSATRLERELQAFVRGRTIWPPAAAFHQAGRARLHRQAVLAGGEAYWAHRFGLALTRPTWPGWPEENIRKTLRLYLEGRETWPTCAEFRADGMERLRSAVTRSGGAERWAAEMGLTRPSRRNGPNVYWTDERIREQLVVLCRGRESFPSRRDFVRADLGGMHRTMQERHGVDWWARRMNVPRAGTTRRLAFGASRPICSPRSR